MYSPPITLATRGILSNSGVILPTAGYLILSVEVGPIPPRPRPQHGGAGLGRIEYPDQKKKYYVKVKFQIEDKEYTEIKYINKKIKVSADNISIELVDDKPLVKISFNGETF